MNKVVITGATGMIGINLIKYLNSKDIEVLAIIRKNSFRRNLLTNIDKLKIIECDLEDFSSITLEDDEYDVFFHLAWDGTFGNLRNDVYRQNLNVKYTLDSVRLAKKLGCKRFIGIGSQAEYGRVNEKMSPDTRVNPENGYGVAKFSAGVLSRILANELEIEHIWARIFSVYGPYDNENTMIMSSIKEMIENGKSPDYTKAEQIWDYLYVEDAVEALYLAATKGKNSSIYCIGSGKQLPLYKYIETIRDNIDENIHLNIGAREYLKNQVMSLVADITDLKKDTGFYPKVEFDDGINRTINWYKGDKNEKN